MKQLFLSNKSIFALIAAIVTATTTVSAQDEQTAKRDKFIVDEVVAVVGSSSIMLSDLVSVEQYLQMQQMQQGYSNSNAKGEALEFLLTQKLLTTQAAIDSIAVNEASVEMQTESKMSQLIESRGSASELEKFYSKPIYAIKDIVRTKTRETEMANSMQATVEDEVSITPSEVSKFYRKANTDSLPIIPDQYKIAKIAKLPSKSESRKLDVKEDLLELRNRIINGASFGALARMYSDDLVSAGKGGVMDPQPSSNFVQTFRDAVESLKIGQISEVIETEYGYHILEVMEQRGSLYQVRHILKKIKFNPDDKEKAIMTLDSVATEIKDGNLDFNDAVLRYSEDPNSRMREGIVVNSLYEYYGAKYKSELFSMEELRTMYDKISSLKVGDISNVFVNVDETTQEEEVVIVKLVDFIPSHTADIERDYTIIEEMALAEKRNNVFKEWLNNKINDMYVHINKEYMDINLENSRWKK